MNFGFTNSSQNDDYFEDRKRFGKRSREFLNFKETTKKNEDDDSHDLDLLFPSSLDFYRTKDEDEEMLSKEEIKEEENEENDKNDHDDDNDENEDPEVNRKKKREKKSKYFVEIDKLEEYSERKLSITLYNPDNEKEKRSKIFRALRKRPLNEFLNSKSDENGSENLMTEKNFNTPTKQSFNNIPNPNSLKKKIDVGEPVKKKRKFFGNSHSDNLDDDPSNSSSFIFDDDISMSENIDIININSLFDKYASLTSGKNSIGTTGLFQLKKDLCVTGFFNFQYFFFVYLLNVKSKYQILRSEWLFGFYNNGIDNLYDLKKKLIEIEDSAYNEWGNDEVKKFFGFVFKYLCDHEKSRSICIHTATNALRCLMSEKSFFLENFIEFVKVKFKVMNADQFKIFYDFSRTIKSDFSNFNVIDCWPTMYDEFYLYEIKKRRSVSIVDGDGDEIMRNTTM